MNTVFLSLGSNLGNTYEYLNQAVLALFNKVGPVLKISPVYMSPALGFDGPDFYNCAVKLETTIDPEVLLKKVQAIENELGRERKGEGYQSRTIDIDILLYNDDVINIPSLKVPHSLMLERKFVLQPLTDIAATTLIPTVGQSVQEALKSCQDSSVLVKQPKWLKNPKGTIEIGNYNYIAIEGNIGAGKTSLAHMIAKEFNAKLILERFKDNAFLPKFYDDPDRYAFPLEMSFLADRYQQLLDDIGQFDLFTDFILSDYDRYKSLVFAKVTLQEEEYIVYKRLHEMMYRDTPTPDLYIYLYQNTERLLENIKKRGRDFEKGIKAEYLEKINQGYLDFIKNQQHLTVKIIDISELDFVKNREDYLSIINQF